MDGAAFAAYVENVQVPELFFCGGTAIILDNEGRPNLIFGPLQTFNELSDVAARQSNRSLVADAHLKIGERRLCGTKRPFSFKTDHHSI